MDRDRVVCRASRGRLALVGLGGRLMFQACYLGLCRRRHGNFSLDLILERRHWFDLREHVSRICLASLTGLFCYIDRNSLWYPGFRQDRSDLLLQFPITTPHLTTWAVFPVLHIPERYIDVPGLVILRNFWFLLCEGQHKVGIKLHTDHNSSTTKEANMQLYGYIWLVQFPFVK